MNPDRRPHPSLAAPSPAVSSPSRPSRRIRRVDGMCLALSLALTATLAAAVPSAALQTARVASGLNRPIFVTAPPGDDRLFIVEQRGVIRILQNGALLPTPFLDINALIPDPSDFDERGLLGLAFDPDFVNNRRFYVNYISNSIDTIIARYLVSQGDPDVADPNSSEILLTIDQPFNNHNGGTIAFSPLDGYLYVGMGDGGSSGDPEERAQNPQEWLGKVLRIDVSGASGYVVPADNPFVGNPAYRPEIWALGVRNPYRSSFDRQTGDLWIADVGQNLWVEISFEAAGSGGGFNYGWDIMEANHCFEPPSGCDQTGLVLPIHEYSHNEGCSITGGCVYRGAAIPSLAGTYFFADYCTNKIWSLRYDGQSVSEFTDRTVELAPGGGLSIGAISGFGEDGDGELYIVDRGSTTTGEVYKILPDPAGAPDRPGTGAIEGLKFRSAAPNPARAAVRFELESSRPGPLSVSIVDAAGRVVRELSASVAPDGSAGLSWDGRDRTGRDLPAGSYFARAAQDEMRVTRRISLVR